MRLRKYNFDKEQCMKIIENSKKRLIVLGDKEGYVDGDTKKVLEAFFGFASQIVERKILDKETFLNNILKACGYTDNGAFSVKANTIEEAIEKMNRKLGKMIK